MPTRRFVPVATPHRLIRGGLIGGLIGLALLAGPGTAQETSIGTVKAVFGRAVVVRGEEEIEARPGLPLMETDIVRTGGDGRLGLSLKDETRLSLGPDTRVELEQFVFAPAEQRLGLTVRVLRGIAAFVTGRMAKLAPEAVRIETPTSIIGVRGTHVLVKVP
jgi:hypothetical protein